MAMLSLPLKRAVLTPRDPFLYASPQFLESQQEVKTRVWISLAAFWTPVPHLPSWPNNIDTEASRMGLQWTTQLPHCLTATHPGNKWPQYSASSSLLTSLERELPEGAVESEGLIWALTYADLGMNSKSTKCWLSPSCLMWKMEIIILTSKRCRKDRKESMRLHLLESGTAHLAYSS